MGDYLGLLREVAEIEPPLFTFGSVAEAVLLDGALASSPGDLDVLVPRAQLDRRLKQLGGLGFAEFSVYYEPRPGLPMVLGAARDDVAVEVSVVDVDAEGAPYFALRTDPGVVSVSVPADLFAWPPTIVADVVIHTISPLALFQIRAGCMTTQAFGVPRDRDASRQQRLKARFFPDAAEATLQPVIALMGRPG